MDLKNYLLEYVSSGRRKKNIPVEPDAVLKVGDVVRIKDEKWFDSLEKDWRGYGIVVNRPVGDIEGFIEPMKEYLGKKVIVTEVFSKNNAKRSVRYSVCLAEGDNQEELAYIFTNEMLEYI